MRRFTIILPLAIVVGLGALAGCVTDNPADLLGDDKDAITSAPIMRLGGSNSGPGTVRSSRVGSPSSDDNSNDNADNTNANDNADNTNGNANDNADNTNANDNTDNANDNGDNGNANDNADNTNANDNTDNTNANDNGDNGNGNDNGGAAGPCPDGSLRTSTDSIRSGSKKAEIEYRRLASGCERFRVKVEGYARATYDVVVGGAVVAQVVVGSNGKGEIDQRFPDGSFPDLAIGASASVGALSGTMSLDCSEDPDSCS